MAPWFPLSASFKPLSPPTPYPKTPTITERFVPPQHKNMIKSLSFLLTGHVQGVKMRRYVESAGQHFGVGGYVINIDEDDAHDPGAVFGQAWEAVVVNEQQQKQQQEMTSRLELFEQWIKGEWTPREYTNVKPTPIGTAYPEKAHVEGYAVMVSSAPQPPQQNDDANEEFVQFTMVRGDEDASRISEATAEVRRTLSLAMNAGGSDTSGRNGDILADAVVTIGSWPSRT
jgi:hypothetical protein